MGEEAPSNDPEIMLEEAVVAIGPAAVEGRGAGGGGGKESGGGAPPHTNPRDCREQGDVVVFVAKEMSSWMWPRRVRRSSAWTALGPGDVIRAGVAGAAAADERPRDGQRETSPP